MKFLVGYDGSNASKEALNQAILHAKALEATVDVFTSVTTGSVTEKVEIQYAKEDLEQVKQQLADQSIPCETAFVVSEFSPGEELVNYAKEKAIDLVVIGVKRRSKVGKILFGSNAQYVVVKAPCPVLTVK